MATKTRTTKNTRITLSHSLVPAGMAHTVSLMDTDPLALVPVGYAFTTRESVHGGVIIDADPLITVPVQTPATTIHTADGAVTVEMDDYASVADAVAQSTVGYVRNASRAIYARYIVKMAIKMLDAVNNGHEKWPDGSDILYRVADVAALVLNTHRKTHDLPSDLDLPRMRAMLAAVVNAPHHAKCLIAGGLFNSTDLPSAILWDAARKMPFYALPNSESMPFLSLVYGDEMGHGAGFNHQIASDYLARINPAYITPILYAYVSQLNTINQSALRAFLRVFLDDSRMPNPPTMTRMLDRAHDAACLYLAEPHGNQSLGYLAKLH